MKTYFLLNLAELAEKRAILMRQEAQLWDILCRDLKREAKRQNEDPASQNNDVQIPIQRQQQGSEQIDGKMFVRIAEAARIMGLGRSSLYKEINASRLKVRKAGRNTLIAVSDIQSWFDALQR